MTTRPPKFMVQGKNEGATRPAQFAVKMATPRTEAQQSPVLLAEALAGAAVRPAPFGARGGMQPPAAAHHHAPEPHAAHFEAPPAPPAPSVEPRILSALSSLSHLSQVLREQAESDALELGFIIARRIIETEIHQNPHPLIETVRSAIQKMGETHRYDVRVSTDTFERLEEMRRVETNGLSGSNIRLIPDPKLGPADCLIQGDHASVDARLSVRLMDLARAAEIVGEDAQ